jgi:D-erythro-7,8-dihydroneopterin triphosphate epimerase
VDRILIRDLRTRTIIGVRDWERREKQEVILNIVLTLDLTGAMRSDNLDDSVDYSAIKKRILDMVEGSSFNLCETLASHIADVCLEFPRVQEVEVTVDKPGALRFARSVAVRITRKRSE